MHLRNRWIGAMAASFTASACLLTSGPVAGQTAERQPAKRKVELTDQNYAEWRKHILPDTGEVAWQQIPWATTFKDGIVAADAAGKPLLLWTMNGHPLGCT